MHISVGHRKPIYLIKARQEYAGLHTITAPHLLCERLHAGDEVVAVLEGEIYWTHDVAGDDESAPVQGNATLRADGWRIEGHQGRAALLGDDGMTGPWPSLAELWLERLAGAQWEHAPVVATEAPGARCRLDARWTPDGGWKLDEDVVF